MRRGVALFLKEFFSNLSETPWIAPRSCVQYFFYYNITRHWLPCVLLSNFALGRTASILSWRV